LEPVGFPAGRCLWANIEVDRPIVVYCHFALAFLTVVAGERLAGLELEADLGIVEYDRYELLGGRVLGKVQLIGLASVQIAAIGIQIAPGILRTLADQLPGHCRRVDGREVEELGTRINIPPAHAIILEEFIRPAYETSLPIAAFIKECRFIWIMAILIQQGASILKRNGVNGRA
jgi:hypothetical protein